MSSKLFCIPHTDISGLEKKLRANFFNKLSGYKSPVLVGTKSKIGQVNLAVFSNIFHIGAEDQLIGMISRPDVVARHTLENIKEVHSYTLNFLHSHFLNEIHQTSARYERDESEFSYCGLKQEYQGECIVPFVKEAEVKIEMKLQEVHDLKINGTHIIIGKLQNIYSARKIDPESFSFHEFSNLAVSGIDSYLKTDFLVKKKYAKKS